MAVEVLARDSQTRNQELLGFLESVFALANPGEYISIGKKGGAGKGWAQKNFKLSELFAMLRSGEADIRGRDMVQPDLHKKMA